jgi:hypothetical protein
MLNTSTFLPTDFVNDANDEGTIGQAKVQKEEFLELRAALRLQRGKYLLGRILDENRLPISGARIVQNYQWHEPHANVITGNDGSFEICNARTGSLTLSIQAAHYSPQALSLTVQDSMTNAPITSTRGRILRGRVIDSDGGGMADAEARKLLDELTAHATQRQFVHSHRWRVKDLVIWDDRCTMHRGMEFDDQRYARDMRRATVSDVAPTCEQMGLAVAAE